MRNDIRYTCNKCGYKASRRDDAVSIDLNCPSCPSGRLVKIQTIKDAKNAKARQEIEQIYKGMDFNRAHFGK